MASRSTREAGTGSDVDLVAIPATAVAITAIESVGLGRELRELRGLGWRSLSW